ncbi:MAG: hypothetical protein ACYTFE_02590, partial [Planctomycetota bacterium]
MVKYSYLKTIVLISSIIFLTNSLIFAEDLNPPDFAGGSNTGVAFWEFDADTDQPTSYNYIPPLSSPVFGFRYYSGAWQWQSGGGISGDGSMLLQDEESIVLPVPNGSGSNLTVQLQLTWKGVNPNHNGGMDIEIWEGGESWTGGYEFPPDGHLGGGDTLLDETSLSDGWTHSTYEATFSSSGVTHVHIIMHMDYSGDTYIDEAVVDMVVHDGSTPPTGPGRAGASQVELLGTWDEGTTHTAEAGDNRGL